VNIRPRSGFEDLGACAPGHDACCYRGSVMMSPWVSRSPLVLAAVVVAALTGTALLVAHTVRVARDGTTRDAGEANIVALRERIRSQAPLDAAALATLLEDERDQGLRYVAIVGKDGAVLASAGTPLGMSMELGTFEEIGNRVRMVRRAPIWRGKSAPVQGDSLDVPISAVVIEFVPLVANQLHDDVRVLAVVTVATSLVIVGFALWMVRGARQRDRLQIELERGRRLAALGEMSAVIAHEVKNPLASLKGNAQLLVETMPEGGPGRAKADRVVAEATRLERLTSDLLEFVKSGELRRAPTDARVLVDEVAAEVGPGRVDVTAEGAVAGWPLDAGRLRQAVTNVIQNAIQASPSEGRVEVDVTADDQLTIAVKDRGPGIPAGEERAIFEPFHTRRAKGVGLGLAIARRMVELHGGTIVAGQRPGGGAVVTITVPRKS
jgi:two-component system sensor histidine kinase HydH